ncbi:MAG: hypothetical protein M3N16_08235 [Actinomycetota bacterium]|nr:hypothetical protein [Actinomycetota bacterium]
MSTTATADAASQQLRALEQANRVRLARAELKRRVAAAEVTAAEVIVECPWEAARMPIGELLRSQRRWGQARCRRLLTSLSLPENKEIGSLTDRQRRVLETVLGAKEGERRGAAPETTAGALAASGWPL